MQRKYNNLANGALSEVRSAESIQRYVFESVQAPRFCNVLYDNETNKTINKDNTKLKQQNKNKKELVPRYYCMQEITMIQLRAN